MPRVTEANEISKELKRGVRFETKITPVMTKAQGMVSTVVVRVYDSERDIEWVWDKSKFINRVYLMREMYEKFENGELVGKGLNDESDPFWDPNEPVNIGYCSVLVKPLSYCLSVEDDYALYREAHQASHPGPMHRVRVAPSRRVRVCPRPPQARASHGVRVTVSALLRCEAPRSLSGVPKASPRDGLSCSTAEHPSLTSVHVALLVGVYTPDK